MSNETMLAFESHGRITVGTVESASVLDALNVAEFGQAVLSFVERQRDLQLLLDFSNVNYLSSAVLTELLRIKEAAEKGGGTMRLCGLNDDIRKVFTITNLDKVLVLYGDTEDGITKFERSLDRAEEDDAWEGI
jgi:anti-sigma B factor antagonist